MEPQTLRLNRLKRFASHDFPVHSVAREVIMAEPDELSTTDFLMRSRVWLEILHAERRLDGSR